MTKEWNTVYRDMLTALNAMSESTASAKTLFERDTRAFEEIKEDGNRWKARAESAEADLARIGAMLNPHAPLDADGIIEAIKAMSREIDELGAKQGWRPVDDLDLDRDIEAEIMMRATFQHEYGAWDARSINILRSDVDFWRPAPPQ